MRLGRTVQARVVDAVKRAAIRRLHRTSAGEAHLLEIYLWAEDSVDAETFGDLAKAAPWLRAQLDEHAADERRHATLLHRRMRELGYAPRPARVDWLSRRKLAQLRALGRRAASEFGAGLVVPLLAVAFRMEAMGVRVLGRHVDVLRRRAPHCASLPLLVEILDDERAHERGCGRALDRLVTDGERPALAALIARIDAIDRRHGIAGALALYAWSVAA